MEEKNITYRTRIHYIIPSQELINEARLSNNLYNQALYILRQAFTSEDKIPSKFDLAKILRHKEYECEEYNNFSKMVSCNAEQITQLAAQNFKAFLMSLKAFKKNKSNFTGVPKIPSYNKKDQEFMVSIGVWINNSISIEFALILQAISTVLIAICDGYSFKKLERIAYK